MTTSDRKKLLRHKKTNIYKKKSHRKCIEVEKSLKLEMRALSNTAGPTASVELPGRTDGARTIPERRVLSGLFLEGGCAY